MGACPCRGIDLCDAQGNGTGLLIDDDIPAVIAGGKGDAVTPGDITRRSFGFDQIICRVGQKCRPSATAAVHLDAADTLVAGALIDVEPRSVEPVGIVFTRDGGVG